MLDEFKKTNSYADKAPEKAVPVKTAGAPKADAPKTPTPKKQEAHA